MRWRSLSLFSSGPIVLLLLAASQDPKAPLPSPQEIEAMMAKAKGFTQPGPNHKHLERFVGTWTTETRFTMGDQKTPSEVGETVCTWSIPGRWIEMKATGKLMGKPYQAQVLLGHDNFKQSFVMTTVNNVDTAMLRSEGDLTRDGKALILYGTLDEYLTGEHDKMVKYVYRFLSADHIVLEVHDLPIGETGTMVVEIDHRRKG